MKRIWTLLSVLVVFGVALHVRLRPLSGVFGKDHIVLTGADSYYHLRRLRMTLANYPVLPFYDAYVNYPEGSRLDWPAGFDFPLATFCRVAETMLPGERVVESAAVLANPLLGALVCVMVMAVTRQLAGRGAAFVAGLLAANLGILVWYSEAGRIDHHAAEPLLILLPLLFFLRALQAPAERLRWPAVWAGTCLAAGIAVWPGSVIVAFLSFLALSFAVIASWRRPELQARAIDIGVLSFTTAALVMLPITLLHPWWRDGSFGYFAPSWLQPVLFSAAALSFHVQRRRGPGSSWARLLFAWLAMNGILGSGVVLALPGLRQTLVDGLRYLAREETQIAAVAESVPLLQVGFLRIVQAYSPLVLLAPVAFLYPLWSVRRQISPRREASGYAHFWLLCTAALGLAQLRLGSLSGPLWCVTWGVLALEFHAWLRARWGRPRATAILGSLAILVGLPIVLQERPAGPAENKLLRKTRGAVIWLRENAPPPGDPLAGNVKPAYATLARWAWGHWLTEIAGQANIANPLGQTPPNLRGVRRSVEYLLEVRPDKAARLLDELGVRYVLVSPILSELSEMVRHLEDPPDYFIANPVSGEKELQFAFLRTMNTRLLYFDGAEHLQGGVRLSPLRRLRLVFETRAQASPLDDAWPVPSFGKLFESVRGARLKGVLPPGTQVFLELALETNRGRSLVYRDRTEAAEDGAFSFLVPYATEGGPTSVHSSGPYAISDGSASWRVHVRDEDVLSGSEIVVPIR